MALTEAQKILTNHTFETIKKWSGIASPYIGVSPNDLHAFAAFIVDKLLQDKKIMLRRDDETGDV